MGREIEAKSCVREFLILFAAFVRYKVTVDENVSFTDYVSGNPSSGFLEIADKLGKRQQ